MIPKRRENLERSSLFVPDPAGIIEKRVTYRVTKDPGAPESHADLFIDLSLSRLKALIPEDRRGARLRDQAPKNCRRFSLPDDETRSFREKITV